ncbi:MAG: rhamnogalacturonan acetylesterase [Niabella sp.]
MKRLFIAFGCAVLLLGFRQEKKITVYSIGDSTMCDYDQRYLNSFGGAHYPIRGWMQMMPQFFNDEVAIHNMARSGRSSKSFKTEGFWKKTIDQVKPSDYVFIMFGPNDEKPDTARHTDPQTTYREYMTGYINETRAKKAIPVLFTSLTRRRFDKTGKLMPDSYSDYVTEVRNLAKEMNVPLIDLNVKFRELVQNYGPAASAKLYVQIEPGQFTKLPDGKKDNTHLCVLGATEAARLAAAGLKELKLPIAKYLKP